MNKNIVEIDGEAFFTAGYMMEQMEAVTNLYRRTRKSVHIWQTVTAVAVLLSLLAIAIR